MEYYAIVVGVSGNLSFLAQTKQYIQIKRKEV